MNSARPPFGKSNVANGSRSNIDNPNNGALWAAPGTMVAAWHMWEATREDRWRALFLENADGSAALVQLK